MAVEKVKDDAFTVNKSKKGKKQKTGKHEATEFNLDFTALNKFSLVRISPPSAPDELDAKIEELSTHRKQIQDQGEKKLVELKAKAHEQAPGEVDKFLLRGEDEQVEEEEKGGDERDDRRGKRRNTGGEFEDKDEDAFNNDVYKAPPRTSKAQRGRGKKANLNNYQEEFPAL